MEVDPEMRALQGTPGKRRIVTYAGARRNAGEPAQGAQQERNQSLKHGTLPS
jgi:hypothetical protein